MSNLANLLNARGQNAEALASMRNAWRRVKKRLGRSPHTLASCNNLAMVLRDKGDSRSRRGALSQGLESMQRVGGPDHGDTLSMLNNLANVLSDMGEYERAEPALPQLVRSLELVWA